MVADDIADGRTGTEKAPADLSGRYVLSRTVTGGLIVRLRAPRLHSMDLVAITEDLAGRKPRLGAFVSFDFSGVEELCGAWSVHFAVLIAFARWTGVRTMVTGLSGQPAAVASLFRRSPEVQALCLGRTAEGGVVVRGMALRDVA